MTFHPVFAAQKAHLQALSDDDAVAFFRELLWAEATSLAIPKSRINVPSAITAPDGGIDAEVEAGTPLTPGQGIIRPGTTRYQIKTGDFRPTHEANVNKILFTPSSLRSGRSRVLQPRVKSCFDNDGTLVVVLFGWDDPETRDELILDRFHAALATVDERYRNAPIEIWGQNRLIGFLSAFPSLLARITGSRDMAFYDFATWSRQEEMRKPFHKGVDQANFIEQLRSRLAQSSRTVHLHVWGEPGRGKTRLVLETLNDESLSPLVLYFDTPQKLIGSVLLRDLMREDSSAAAIIVVDECDQDSRYHIWNNLAVCGPTAVCARVDRGPGRYQGRALDQLTWTLL